MNLQRLKALRAVMTTGSVTEAANVLGLTQPAVSRLISALEAEVGFDLFVREYGRLQPTDEGKLFFQRAERVLSGIDELSDIARDIRFYRDGELRLLCTPQAGYTIFPLAIARFAQKYPLVRVNLQIIQRRDVGNVSRATEFDLGFTAVPFDYPSLTMRRISYLPAVAVVSNEHALAARNSLVMDDLGGESWIMLSSDNLLRSQIELAMAKKNIRPRFAIETSSPIAACKLVALGLGVSIVDPFSARFVAQEGVSFVHLREEIGLTYGFFYLDKKPMSKLSEDFMAIVDSILRDIAQDHPLPLTRNTALARGSASSQLPGID